MLKLNKFVKPASLQKNKNNLFKQFLVIVLP